MKKRLRNILAILTMLMFVNFVFSNTIFVHTHTDGDHSYTHSHPYLPSSGHSHSQNALNLIAGFNATATAFQSTVSQNVQAPVEQILSIGHSFKTSVSCGFVLSLAQRGPPACLLS